METSGISEKIANNMIDKKVRNNVDNALKYMKQNNINVISVFDDDYPQMLKEIYAPPICLYIKGNLQLLKMQNIIRLFLGRSYFENSVIELHHALYSITYIKQQQVSHLIFEL